MAFANQIDDEEENVEGQPGLIGGETSVISGQGTTQQGGAPTPVSANPAQKGGGSAPGSNFVGIQQYIDQNKPQSGKLANQVGGYVEGLSQGAKDQLANSETQYNQVVDQNTVNYNSGLFDEVNQNAAQVAADQAKKDEVTKQRTAQYAGPSSFLESDYYNPTQNAVKKAQAATEQTLTEEGQKQLLGQFQNKDKLNQGALSFDSALLQSDPVARERLEQARQSGATLGTDLDTLVSSGLTKAQQAAAATQATNQQANQALGTDWQALKDLVTGKVTEAKGKYTPASAFSSTGTPITDSQLANVGLTRSQYESMKNDAYVGSNLAQYVTAPTELHDINTNTVASQDDYAREAALMALAGYDSSQDFIKTPELAGTGVIANTPFNKSLIAQKGIDAAKARYDAAMVIANRKHNELVGANALDVWKGTGRDEAEQAYKDDKDKYNSWKL